MNSADTTPRKRRRKIDRDALPMIAYLRVSTAKQADSGLGIDAQRAALTAWAQAEGVEITFLEDAGRSGARMANRPALQDALGMIRDGKAAGIVVSKLDRLSRNAAEILTLADEAQADGWRLAALDLHLDTATPAGGLILGVLASAAAFERARIAERNADKADALRREGKPRGRAAVPVEIADRIIAMRDQGDTYRAIADVLNAEGIPTARGGVTWHAATIRSAENTRRREIEAQAAA